MKNQIINKQRANGSSLKCFVPIEEDLLTEIWRLNPDLVAPFSRASDSTIKCITSTHDSRPHQEEN